ncbi:hypothetical protein H257_04998 [Aphanomyces astaci]|uniref:Cyclic nucleotide-binding domain-containing protein n=1 Tax=Aphanomyces astaci TaxID=112090 RepID=W4GSM6_APHAT|nr:hypothetical protein H257_04998 [Aphanomyces astaci]ETV82336.1 hypothetical protein H257_04998 [Aphanomyces astaci]|eukprot:XP_009828005.1 hypothetical protein H257_04998 [Aphanomyces astaci]
MDGAKHASVHVVPILEEPNEPINLDHIAHTLDQTELNPIFPQWLVERKDFQTFFPRFGTRALSEDEKLRMAAQKEPEKRNGIDIQLLSKWLLNVPSLKALNVMQAGEIAKRMRWASFAPNQLVFKKGDIGDACYIIVNGQVDIVVNGEKVGRLVKGMNFGEVALEQEDALRTADIQVTESGPADLLLIRAEDYQKNVYRYQSKRRKKLTKWLRTEVSIFRDFSDNKLRYFESVSIDLFLHPGNCVYMEGEAVGALYIVKSGTISLEKNVLFETKHRRPTGIKAWSVQSHKTHIQVPSYVVESAGCFGMEYFVKIPTRAHTAVVKTETHLVVINKIDCASTVHSFSVKAIDKLSERYRTIWNATLQATTAQVSVYEKAQKISRGYSPGHQAPITVNQKHPTSQEPHPNLQFPSLSRAVWTASNNVVAKAQDRCYTPTYTLGRSVSTPTLSSVNFASPPSAVMTTLCPPTSASTAINNNSVFGTDTGDLPRLLSP